MRLCSELRCIECSHFCAVIMQDSVKLQEIDVPGLNIICSLEGFISQFGEGGAGKIYSTHKERRKRLTGLFLNAGSFCR